MANTTLQAESAKSTICLLLPVWAEAVQRGYAEGLTSSDPQYDCSAVPNAVLQAIMGVPATTAEDMAIKAYLAIVYELGANDKDPMGIDWTGGIMSDASPHRALVADAVRLSPMLASIIQSGILNEAA
jgi:hypothetical protein